MDFSNIDWSSKDWSLLNNKIDFVTSGSATDQNSFGVRSGGSETDKAAASINKGVGMLGKLGGGFNSFSQGFQAGYQGTKVITDTMLAYRSAKQEKAILGMKAQISDWNAKSYQTAAEDVLRAGQQQVASLRFRAGQVKASTRVSQAAAGIRIGGSGSASEVLTSQAIVTEMQTNQILANAITQSFGYRRQQTQAKINSLAIRSERNSISPWTSAICTHINSAVEAAPSIYSMFGKK